MPFISQRAKLQLTSEEVATLQQIASSRSEPAGRVRRAEVLLRYHQGQTVSAIAAHLRTNRPKVERCISKALQMGAAASLRDLPRAGRPSEMTAEARAWVVSLACQKPKDLGYSYELWTTRLLAQHIRAHC